MSETPDDVASQNRTEDKILQIWGEVLQVPVSIDDQFLDLGGDSLAAMLCISRMRAIFRVDFEVDDFFLAEATVAFFASKIDNN